MRTILFICTGNTCRSPMAEAVAQHWLDQGVVGPPGEALAASAGVAAATGSLPTPEAVAALASVGLEADGRSKPLTAEMIAAADVVFGMTRGHVAAARDLAGADTTALIEPLDPGGDVDDPIGMGQEAYDRLVARFMDLIPKRLAETLLGSERRAGDATS